MTPLVDPVLVLARNVLCVSSDFRVLNLQNVFLVFSSAPKLLILGDPTDFFFRSKIFSLFS